MRFNLFKQASKKMHKHKHLFLTLSIILFVEVVIGVSFYIIHILIIRKSAIIPLKQPVYATVLNPTQYNYIRNQLFTLVNKQDPRVAIERVKELSAHDPKVFDSCHDLLHDIGRESYEKYKDFAKTMQYRDEFCVSGYTHGALEGYFSQSKDAFSKISSVCDTYPTGKFIRQECLHGLGHGLMYYTANDLPVALQECQILHSDFDREACTSGAYMENFNADLTLHPSRFVSFSDPFKPCRENIIFRNECYFIAPIYFLNYQANNFAAALMWCDNAPLIFRGMCYQGVGTQAARREIATPKLTEKLCTSQGKQKAMQCLFGMAIYYVDYYFSLDAAKEVCDQLQTPNKKICLQAVDSDKSLF